jgi:conjugative transposon TraK protein
MFHQLKNIETAFKHVRLFTVALIVACAVICCYITYQMTSMVQAAGSRIYLLYNGKVLEAVASGRKDNIPVEARDHIATFHQYFFSLDPDEKVIESNIRRALYLADYSAKQQYDDLKEKGYYAGIISGNVSQHVEVDSISVNTDVYPYYFRYYGKERIIRPTTIVLRSLVTEGYIRNTARSDNNPHGFLCEKWTVLENADISQTKR